MEADGPIPARLRKRTILDCFNLLVQTQNVAKRVIILPPDCSSVHHCKEFSNEGSRNSPKKNKSVFGLSQD